MLLAAILLFLPGTGRAQDWKAVLQPSFLDDPGSALSDGDWWTTGNDALFIVSPEGGSVASGNACGGKTIALLDCAPSGDYKIKLEADVQPGGPQWLAIGFAKDKDFFWTPAGQLWLTIGGTRDPGGEGVVGLNARGAHNVKRFQATDYGFDPAKPTHVELIYDQPANTVSLKLNGKSVLENHELKPFVPEIKAAGLMMNYPLPNDPKMRLADFKVSLQGGAWQPALQPEPARAG